MRALNQARADISEYFDWYNNKRVHSRIGNMTPVQKYELPLNFLQETA